MPEVKKAELMEGVVYMASPVRAISGSCSREIIFYIISGYTGMMLTVDC